MLDKNILKQSLCYSAGAVLYVAVVATLMTNAERVFGPNEPEGPLVPIAFLLLLVVSVATMGMLIFGKPVILYIDGKRREGVAMAVYTISFMAGFTILLLAALAANA